MSVLEHVVSHESSDDEDSFKELCDAMMDDDDDDASVMDAFESIVADGREDSV